ncbi:hypothetical protein Tco_0624149 [Tanacetum coccineum]|uniref:Reverse transcriptase domain-containing protein n=1 Tax=Tanacetum coccineum TaxID=301880 RepID=A0ABQ4WD74_9ASTR
MNINIAAWNIRDFPVDIPEDLLKKKVDPENALYMIRDVSNEEIKVVLFDIEDDKAPGPDGFTSKFFKDSWDSMDVKAITTQSGVAYDGPTIPPTPSPLPKEVERETEATKDKSGTTSRDTLHYMLMKRLSQVNVIDVACEEYAQEVLGFSDSSTSGNPTPSDPIIASSSSPCSLLLREVNFVWKNSKLLSFTMIQFHRGIYDARFLIGGEDIRYFEKLLNEDPSPTLPPMKNDDLKQVDVTMTKPSIKEPPELKLKDLPSHFEYAFLEGTNKLPVIISKELKDKEKVSLLKVLKHVLKVHDGHFPWTMIDGNNDDAKTIAKIPTLVLIIRKIAFHRRKEGIFSATKLKSGIEVDRSKMYTDHSALKYLLAKQDDKPRFLRWSPTPRIGFIISCIKKERSENLTADVCLVKNLENPHKGDLEGKRKINDNISAQDPRNG